MISGRIISLLFLIQASALAQTKFNAITSFNKVKSQVVEMTTKNQRISALTLIENELLRPDPDYRNKLNTLKFNMLNDFVTLAAQEVYETSAAVILSDKKKAQTFMQQCLVLESENLQCQWLELKYLKRYSPGAYAEKVKIYLETIQSFSQMLLVKYSLLIDLGRESEIPTKRKELVSKNMEQDILENLIKYNLALRSAAYFQAKEVVNYLSAHYNDYPDVIFMSYQLSSLWPEGVGYPETVLEKQYEVYRKKCSDLPTSIARKYFFDIALCLRSLK